MALAQNVFWNFPYSDLYDALSWDRLHAYHGGLFSDHLLVEFNNVVNDMGRKSAAEINKRCVSC